MFASADERVAIAALTQDRALIGLLRSVVDPATDVILVTSEAELVPHLNGRRVSVALLDSMYVEGDLAALAERLRDTWSDLVLVVVGTAEEQSKVAGQITSGVVYRFLHRPVSAPRVRLFVEAALRRHEVENVERTLEQQRPDFSRLEAAAGRDVPRGRRSASLRVALGGLVLAAATLGGWYLFTRGQEPHEEPIAEVVSPGAATQSGPATDQAAQAADAATRAPVDAREAPARDTAPRDTAAPQLQPPAANSPAGPQSESSAARPAVEPAAAPAAAQVEETAAVAPSGRVQRTTESAVEQQGSAEPAAPPVLTREQRLREQLAQAETALQNGELASPPGRNAVELFRGALELDPSNTLAKAGLVRVADRLLAAAERALTAGNAEDAKKMVDVAETLTPATARGAFLMMQIEMEHERAALTAKRDNDAQDKLERGATYLRLANTRLRSGALIDPAEDNARFYLEAARQTIPEDPGITELSRALQKELLARASAAATAGNAAETERWLANADGMEAARQDIAAVRRLLQERLLGARTDRLGELAQSFAAALAANKLLKPAESSAKSYLLQLIDTDAASPQAASARQGLGQAYLRELRAALGRNDIEAADAWLLEARTIGFASTDLNAAESELDAARAAAAQRQSVVGANSLARIEYVAPKFPTSFGNRTMEGWVELEFTVRTDGSTGDIVVTNSSPRKLFDASAVRAVAQWRYKPVMLNGKAVEQRAAVRIRFTEE